MRRRPIHHRIRCPACQTLLPHAFVARHAAQAGPWHCPNCGVELDVAIRTWLAVVLCVAAPFCALLLLPWPWQLGLGLPLFALFFHASDPLLAWFSQWFSPVVRRPIRPVRIAVLLACMVVGLMMLALFQAHI